MAQVCPVVGTTTTVLPPDHPQYDNTNPEARCPVTNAKVGHHAQAIHSHPSSPTIPDDSTKFDAQKCPALQKIDSNSSVAEATCPVVGPVSATLPPNHPKMTEEDAGKICPITNATLEHHKNNVHVHPSVPEGSSIQKCPVASNMLK